jgi:hypothetical protein
MTDSELTIIVDAIEEIITNIELWSKEYSYSSKTNEFRHASEEEYSIDIANWFKIK